MGKPRRSLQGSEPQGLAGTVSASGASPPHCPLPLPIGLPLQTPPPCPLISLVPPWLPSLACV